MESPGYHFTSQLHLHKDCPDPASEGAGGDTSPQLGAEAKCWSSCELSVLKTRPSPEPAEHQGNSCFRQSRGQGAGTRCSRSYLAGCTLSQRPS